MYLKSLGNHHSSMDICLTELLGIHCSVTIRSLTAGVVYSVLTSFSRMLTLLLLLTYNLARTSSKSHLLLKITTSIQIKALALVVSTETSDVSIACFAS